MKKFQKFGLAVLTLILGACVNDAPIENNNADDGNTPPVQTTKISMDQAQAELMQILKDVDQATTRAGGTRQISNSYTWALDTENATRSSDEETPCVYVFNFDDEQGFAIMSGDTRVPSLLALAESGSLIEGEEVENPGLQIFLDNMIQTMGFFPPEIPLQPVTPCPEDDTYVGVAQSWENIIYYPNGFCPVKWGQGSPYNDYCPIKEGKPTPVGCVATAVAQLMAVHKYPSTYNNHIYNWTELIKQKYGKNLSPTYKNQLANLMVDLGLPSNLKMNYSPTGSTSSIGYVENTLKNFKFSSTGNLKNYTTSGAVEELKNNIPILIEGVVNEDGKEAGHVWIGHGLMERKREIKWYDGQGLYRYSTYESIWYILCNWGWGATDDGYYLSKVFNTGPCTVLNTLLR